MNDKHSDIWAFEAVVYEIDNRTPTVPLANTESVEMMRVAQLWQPDSVDTAVALGDDRGALVVTEKPRCSPVGNIALRHQIGVLQRSAKKRLQFTTRIACSGSGVLRKNPITI